MIDNDAILQRISKVRAEYKVKQNAIAETSGLSNQTITSQSYGKRGLSLEYVAALLELVPELDARWLLFGYEQKSLEQRVTDLEMAVQELQKNNKKK